MSQRTTLSATFAIAPVRLVCLNQVCVWACSRGHRELEDVGHDRGGGKTHISFCVMTYVRCGVFALFSRSYSILLAQGGGSPRVSDETCFYMCVLSSPQWLSCAQIVMIVDSFLQQSLTCGGFEHSPKRLVTVSSQRPTSILKEQKHAIGPISSVWITDRRTNGMVYIPDSDRRLMVRSLPRAMVSIDLLRIVTFGDPRPSLRHTNKCDPPRSESRTPLERFHMIVVFPEYM